MLHLKKDAKPVMSSSVEIVNCYVIKAEDKAQSVEEGWHNNKTNRLGEQSSLFLEI